MADKEQRVVLSGLGPISAAGVGIEPLWDAMCCGLECDLLRFGMRSVALWGAICRALGCDF